MKTKKEVLEIIDRLKGAYPLAECTLDYDHAWQLLVSVRLAAQCTDARVNIVTEELFAKYPSVAALAEADPADIEAMLTLLDRLVDSGRTVVVIEHHQAVMAHADWIIDLGPGAVHDGGRVVFTGTPAQMVAERSTLTGQYLAQYVKEDNDDAPE